MRIAIVTPFPPNSVGGVERFVFVLQQALESKGHTVTVFDRTSLPNQGRSVWQRLRLGDPKLAYDLGRRFQADAQSFDIVLCNGMYGWQVRFDPAVVVFHGTSAVAATASRGWFRWHTYVKFRYLYGFFHCLSAQGKIRVAVSQECADQWARYHGLQVDGVIENAVDTSKFCPGSDRQALRQLFGLPPHRFLALFVGRPDRRKGFDIVRQVARSLRQIGGEVVAALPCHGAIPSDGMIPLAGVPYEKMPQLYNACNAFFFPSRHEASSLALLEAMACGLPIVASRVGAAMTIVERDPQLGRQFIPSWEPLLYADRLQALAQSATLRHDIGVRGRRYVLQYHRLKQFGDSYVALLERAVWAHRPHGVAPEADERAHLSASGVPN